MTEIVTERLTLRPFRSDDLDAFVAYRSHPEVARYQSWDSGYSMADAERFLASQRGIRLGDKGDWRQLVIVDRARATVCGDCAVRFLPDQPATAEVGVTLDVSQQGNGFATEALTALLAVLFLQHQLHRVVAETDDRNAPVHRLLERLAFRCEARLLEADWFKGEWSTLRTYAMLDHEYAAKQRTERSVGRRSLACRGPQDHKDHEAGRTSPDAAVGDHGTILNVSTCVGLTTRKCL
jgi:RimJ/RimL family protein N-acetyltransferase